MKYNLFDSLKPKFKFELSSDFLVYIMRVISFDRKLMAPSLYMSNNIFILKMHLLVIFFFPVALIMIMFFDSYMTIDYIFFFYTDEADFDDFIALIYMVLFFFLMVTDYDTTDGHNTNNIYDFSELAFKNGTLFSDVSPSYAYYTMDSLSTQPNNVSALALNYYDKNFFSKMLMVSSNSINSIYTFALMNLGQTETKHAFISKLSLGSYILEDSYAYETLNRFNVLTPVAADDVQLQDSSDIYIYSFYFILFDLELLRLFLFINNILSRWLNNSLNYSKFFNKHALIFIKDALDFSELFITVFNKKGNKNMTSVFSFHKVYLMNLINNITHDNDDDMKNNNYIAWFFYRNK